MPDWNTNYEHENKKTNLSLTVNNTQEKSIMQHTHRHTHTHPQNRAKGKGRYDPRPDDRMKSQAQKRRDMLKFVHFNLSCVESKKMRAKHARGEQKRNLLA